MPLPDGWAGLVHGVPAWFSRLLGASQAQVPAGTDVYAQNVDVIDREDRLLGTVTVVQPAHDNLNANANLQVGDVDVANGNPVPVSDAGGSLTVDQATHDNLNANANIQVGDVDVGPANQVPADLDSEYPEDSGHTSGDEGVFVLGVRNDAGGSMVDANGDYAPLQFNNLGQLVVSVAAIIGIAAVVTQPVHDLLNCNANIQVGDADVGPANPVPVDVANNVETTFDHGSNSAIGIAATRFIVAATPAVLGVEVKAANDNTANIYIGNADVTAATADATDGMELGPGESILVRIDDVNKLWAISAADTQRVFWLRV